MSHPQAPLYVVGLDLGKKTDFSALAIAEKTMQPGDTSTYAIRHLERFPLRTAYTDIGRQLAAMLAKPPLPGCTLAVDQTGVGVAVVDILRALNLDCWLVPVTITAGHTTRQAEDGWHVPKKELVGVVDVLLQSDRLGFARGLPEAAIAKRELEMFTVKVSAETGHESLEAWRERDHDDLVFAIALSCWAGEHVALGAWDVKPDKENQSYFADVPEGVFGADSLRPRSSDERERDGDHNCDITWPW